MKANLRRLYPFLHHLTDTELNRAVVADALKAAWKAVPQALINGLIRSMPNRVHALRAARGWYTKY